MRRIPRKSKRILQVEEKIGEELEEALRKKYVDENKSTQTIADELGVTYVTVFKWLQKAGIRHRLLDL